MAKLTEVLNGLDDDKLEELLKRREAARGGDKGGAKGTRKVRVREYETDVDDDVLAKIFGVSLSDEIDDDEPPTKKGLADWFSS